MPKITTNVTMLVILDGFGWRENKKYNAVAQAKKPHFDAWMKEYPYAFLHASGQAVGLPEGFIGNSEVGHLTIGAGRIIKSPVALINEGIKNLSFFSNPTVLDAFERVKKDNGTLHLMGMLSNAGVHADMKHLYAFIKAAQNFGVTKIVIHPFLDGRDSPPKSAIPLLEQLQQELKITNAIIGSIHGRYYAMDRDKNWERTEATYRVLTEPQTIAYTNWKNALDAYYAKNITDEFIPPTQLDPNAVIKNGDAVIFFNFRPDRARQLTAAFIDPQFTAFKRKPITLTGFVTPLSYNTHLQTNVMYPQSIAINTLTHILSKHQKTIFTIAETEKYAHVTYFFNGGKEEPEATESRTLVPTLDDHDTDRSPCMAANHITRTVLSSLEQHPSDFYLINYANADIIGHTGDFDKTITAVQCLDHQLGELYEQVVEKMNGTLYITADHGNAEQMWDEKTNQPWTAHTTNPVPFLWITKKEQGNNTQLPLQQLRDIAPFILKNMGIEVPTEMKK
ncbi:MAG: hypothetical protein ACD_64C00114G0006 [uncultured bacterium]|nr:MAG: hypothetical protein ACD_64C00114G0006 [uncultured bacterium]